MKRIDKFYCIQTEVFGNGTEKINKGIVSIQTELLRPTIQILDKDGSILSTERKTYSTKLISNPYVSSDESLSVKELLFLSDTYGFEIEEHAIYKDHFSSILKINKLYHTAAEIILIEQQEKEYLMIEFKRWQHEYQPRGAGEDSLGEDISYIHGIWEDPFLTDEIVAKIKNSYKNNNSQG